MDKSKSYEKESTVFDFDITLDENLDFLSENLNNLDQEFFTSSKVNSNTSNFNARNKTNEAPKILQRKRFHDDLERKKILDEILNKDSFKKESLNFGNIQSESKKPEIVFNEDEFLNTLTDKESSSLFDFENHLKEETEEMFVEPKDKDLEKLIENQNLKIKELQNEVEEMQNLKKQIEETQMLTRQFIEAIKENKINYSENNEEREEPTINSKAVSNEKLDLIEAEIVNKPEVIEVEPEEVHETEIILQESIVNNHDQNIIEENILKEEISLSEDEILDLKKIDIVPKFDNNKSNPEVNNDPKIEPKVIETKEFSKQASTISLNNIISDMKTKHTEKDIKETAKELFDEDTEKNNDEKSPLFLKILAGVLGLVIILILAFILWIFLTNRTV